MKWMDTKTRNLLFSTLIHDVRCETKVIIVRTKFSFISQYSTPVLHSIYPILAPSHPILPTCSTFHPSYPCFLFILSFLPVLHSIYPILASFSSYPSYLFYIPSILPPTLASFPSYPSYLFYIPSILPLLSSHPILPTCSTFHPSYPCFLFILSFLASFPAYPSYQFYIPSILPLLPSQPTLPTSSTFHPSYPCFRPILPVLHSIHPTHASVPSYRFSTRYSFPANISPD